MSPQRWPPEWDILCRGAGRRCNNSAGSSAEMACCCRRRCRSSLDATRPVTERCLYERRCSGRPAARLVRRQTWRLKTAAGRRLWAAAALKPPPPPSAPPPPAAPRTAVICIPRHTSISNAKLRENKTGRIRVYCLLAFTAGSGRHRKSHFACVLPIWPRALLPSTGRWGSRSGLPSRGGGAGHDALCPERSAPLSTKKRPRHWSASAAGGAPAGDWPSAQLIYQVPARGRR